MVYVKNVMIKSGREEEVKRVRLEDRILYHLQNYGSITSWEAIKEYGVTRISAIIYNLREEGYSIETCYETAKNRYGDKIHYAKYVFHSKGGDYEEN
jgi:hypothetical protein